MDARDPRLAEHRTLVGALRQTLGDAELIETHISTLLLAGDFAYKLRKPLALGFLDFSTAARRRTDCEEELRLNRRTAPQLYLDVLPVFGPAAQARIGRAGEPGEPIDWLLRMRRFDNEGLLDRLASRGALTDAQVDTLAGRVASFHDALPASPAAYGDPQSVLGWACANFEALGSEAPAVLREWTEREFARIAPALALRRHERDELRALAADAARFVLVECTAPEAVLRERIARRLAADHDASDATLEVLDFQLSVREPVAADEAAVTLATDTEAADLVRRCEALAATLLAPQHAVGEQPLIADRQP